MFKNLKNNMIGLTAVAALSLGATQAQALNVGGILIEDGAHIQIGSIFENAVGAGGDKLGGYGEVGLVNNTSAFCAGGLGSCELTFRFGGYTVTHISPSSVVFSGGWINFYVDTTPDFSPPPAGPGNPNPNLTDAAAKAAASDGTLWLTVMGHTNLVATGDFAGATGTLAGGGSILGSVIVGAGLGMLDVDDTGLANGNTAGAKGLANDLFNTDSFADLLGGTADFELTSSFGTGVPPYADCGGEGAAAGPGCLAGGATVKGQIVPEPGTLSILGLGLLGLAATRRRRQAA